MRTNGLGDLEVVMNAELGPLITTWRQEWDAERPYMPAKVFYHAKRENFLTALEYLSSRSGIAKRKINAIQAEQYRFTGLGVADQLLVAMNLEHLLDDGTIHVVPNPRMSLEHWLMRMAERGCTWQ